MVSNIFLISYFACDADPVAPGRFLFATEVAQLTLYLKEVVARPDTQLTLPVG